MTDTLTVSRELLRQVLVRLEIGGPEWERDNMIKALRAALEQPAPVQEPVHKLIYPGGGKALFNRLWHLTCNAVATQSGMRVRTDVLPMVEMKEFLDHLCVLVDSPPQPAPQPAPVQEPAAEILSDVIHRNAKKLVFAHHGLSLPVGTKLYTATQPAPVQEQQPVAWACLFTDDGSLCQTFDTQKEADKWVESDDNLWDVYVAPLYTVQPARL